MKYMHALTPDTGHHLPDISQLCEDAVSAGAIDPMSLRFMVIEYDRRDGSVLGIPFPDVTLTEALRLTAGLIGRGTGSGFLLEPVGFIH